MSKCTRPSVEMTTLGRFVVMMQNVYIGFHGFDEVPTPPLSIQVEAFDKFANFKHTLLEGSLGWGKTDCMSAIIINEALRYPRNVILTGRKFIDSYQKSALTNLLDMLPPELIVRHNKTEHVVELHNKSKIVYMQLDASREAIKKVKSMNLGLFAPDQLEEITEDMWQAAVGQLRRQNSSRRSIQTANPAGHNWIWHKWIKRRNQFPFGVVSGRIWKKGSPIPTCQSDITPDRCDNIHLPWDYIADQLARPERYVRRFVQGSWDNFEGLVWPEFLEEPFNTASPADGGHVVKPFAIPHWWNRYRVLDHGHRNPTVCLWIATAPSGTDYVYNVHYEAGKWVDYHAAVIHAMSGTQGIKRNLADPSMFHEHAEETAADQYAKYGLYWERADNDKVGGIDLVGKMLRDRHLLFFDIPAMHHVFDEIHSYHWKDMASHVKNVPEEAEKKDDHACDCLRYFANHTQKSVNPKKDIYDDDWVDEIDDYRTKGKAFMRM